ncbi:hypothetical protein Q9Q94_08120 [Uliginosibacterium sp. 31-16]|uniref:hypothetical protein n=1 Tax=Uliginosibacterium sp. 31-16 TaxID=3068315 RepID=UPI00273F33AA|nr:hypothetical protein [Uliginosibacterium sp. 31-16]MDP5239491.1 hypothetical protein [Uliginosibacterium sp. 31-16]
MKSAFIAAMFSIALTAPSWAVGSMVSVPETVSPNAMLTKPVSIYMGVSSPLFAAEITQQDRDMMKKRPARPRDTK